MDFEVENIVEDKYWAFGLFAKKDGSIDFKQLREDLKQLEYYIAAISLNTIDGTFSARLCQKCSYKWIFDIDAVDSGVEERIENEEKDPFKDFTSGSVFERFSEHAQYIIERGFKTLSTTLETSPDDFKANGIDINKIRNLVSVSASIQRKVSTAFEHPVEKR